MHVRGRESNIRVRETVKETKSGKGRGRKLDKETRWRETDEERERERDNNIERNRKRVRQGAIWKHEHPFLITLVLRTLGKTNAANKKAFNLLKTKATNTMNATNST